MKNKRFEIPVPIYYFTLHVWICSAKCAEKWYKETLYHEVGFTTTFPPSGGNFLSYEEKRIDPILWVDKDVSKEYLISNLSHEVMHCVIMMLGDRGIELDKDNHEAFTYLMGYLMLEITKKL